MLIEHQRTHTNFDWLHLEADVRREIQRLLMPFHKDMVRYKAHAV